MKKENGFSVTGFLIFIAIIIVVFLLIGSSAKLINDSENANNTIEENSATQNVTEEEASEEVSE